MNREDYLRRQQERKEMWYTFRDDTIAQLNYLETKISAITSLVTACEKEETRVVGWEFGVGSSKLIELTEISKDLNRKNQMLEVVVKGKRHAECHYLLINTSLVNKARVIKHVLDGIPQSLKEKIEIPKSVDIDVDILTFYKVLRDVLPACKPLANGKFALNVNAVPLRDALSIFEAAKNFPLSLLGEERCEVVVRPR